MLIILEIPHRLPPRAWAADSWEDAADRSEQRVDGQRAKVETISQAQAEEMFDAGHEAVAIAKEHGAVVEAVSRPNSADFYPPNDAPSLSAVVHEWISHDLRGCVIFESADELTEWLDNGGSPAGGFAADEAVKEVGRDIGWLPDEDEDEDE